jgi:hypothetical protein
MIRRPLLLIALLSTPLALYVALVLSVLLFDLRPSAIAMLPPIGGLIATFTALGASVIAMRAARGGGRRGWRTRPLPAWAAALRRARSH